MTQHEDGCPDPKNTYPGPHNPATCTSCGMGTETERLKKAVRWAYLTLGFYGTPYNYSKESVIYHPITGNPEGGVMHDGGTQAKEAIKKMRVFLPELDSII